MVSSFSSALDFVVAVSFASAPVAVWTSSGCGQFTEVWGLELEALDTAVLGNKHSHFSNLKRFYFTIYLTVTYMICGELLISYLISIESCSKYT